MIYFNKVSNSTIEDELSHQKGLASGTYNLDSVITQLALDFRRKCYLCESKVTSIRIEHFRPQCLGIDEKFDWFNIFNSCEHCNAIKSDNYKALLDCTNNFPDQHIKFEVEALGPIGQQVKLTQLPESDIHIDTINLLNAVYQGTNKRKEIQAEVIVEDLLNELNQFEDLVRDYLEERDADDLEDIKYEVNNASKFTSFKRWLVKNNRDYHEEISQFFNN
jgi:5-methylcytosine-specific restriction endonuclease McrA